MVSRRRTVGQNSQELGRKYWAFRSSIRSFARTAHSWENELLMSQNDLNLPHSAAFEEVTRRREKAREGAKSLK